MKTPPPPPPPPKHNGISANTLFHFTKLRENLIGILADNFHPRYCLEDIDVFGRIAKNKTQCAATPMVCFCDLPISRLKEHLNYGHYGIGLTKEWAMANGLSPVFYIYEGAYTSESISGVAEYLRKNPPPPPPPETPAPEIHPALNMVALTSFIKPYEGLVEVDGPKSTDPKQWIHKRFYDEREWRFVPRYLLTDSIVPKFPMGRMPPIIFADEQFRNSENYVISKSLQLKFSPSDIKYIFVKYEHEIPVFIHELRRIKGQRYKPETIDLLASRIMSMERVMEDW